MEKLKSLLADKILDLSTENGDAVKAKIDKIQRFRDFANACQTLMIKYPQIEDELVRMVSAGDYDTKVASSRVDTIIRISDNVNTRPDSNESSGYVNKSDVDEEQLIPETFEEQEPVVWKPEDADYEEVEITEEEKKDKGYVPFEEVNADESISPNADVEHEDVKEPSAEEPEDINQKATIRKVVQIAGIVLAVVAIIFIVRFVMTHWQTILIILGIAIAILALVWYIRRKRS